MRNARYVQNRKTLTPSVGNAHPASTSIRTNNALPATAARRTLLRALNSTPAALPMVLLASSARQSEGRVQQQRPAADKSLQTATEPATPAFLWQTTASSATRQIIQLSCATAARQASTGTQPPKTAPRARLRRPTVTLAALTARRMFSATRAIAATTTTLPEDSAKDAT